MAVPAIETTRLTRRFARLTAVDELSLHVAPGSIFGLLGPNGAGKSTVIKMLTTLLPPTSGGAEVAGFDVVRQPRQIRRRIGYVPQAISADGGLTGYENLLIFAKIYGLPRSERQERIQTVLDLMELGEARSTLVQRYSGGMVRRLEIGLAVLHRPSILFLDEPTVGLDPTARRTVWQHLQELHRNEGTTIFLTTHQMTEADTFCDRVAILHRARVVGIGSPAELKASAGAHATMDDAFTHYTGAATDQEGNLEDVARNRDTASRLG